MDTVCFSPAEAEEGQVEAQQRGHDMPDKGTGLAGVQIEPKPAGCEQGKELAGHKVHLRKTDMQSESEEQVPLALSNTHKGEKLDCV